MAFFKRQGVVNLTHTCSATTIPRNGTVACEVGSQNFSPSEANVTIRGLASDDNVEMQNASATTDRATGTLTPTSDGFEWVGTLDASIAPTVDSITPGGSPAGYLPLSAFDVAPIGGMGDETIVNFNTPPFLWGDETYTRVGVTSNGYAVIGGGTSADVEFEPQTMPDPARPNNVIAPFWTDIDLSGGACTATNCGARIEILSDGQDDWLVIDWENVPTFSNHADIHDFQIWIGLTGDANPGEDVTTAHGDIGTGEPGDLTNAGAENRDGTSGVNFTPADDTDWTINTSPPTPGGKVEIAYDAFGARRGRADLIARMTSSLTAGTTTEIVSVQVR